MGATVSILQANQLPEVIEQTEFVAITGSKFTPESYDAFADHNGKISRQRLLEIVSMTDCYLSHEWGIDKEGRNTSERVQKIGKFLQSKGLYATFDEGQVKGNFSFDAIKERIRNAQCVIMCMTERYFYQARSPVNNPTKVEFEEIMNNKDLRVLVPIILEKAAFAIPEFITSACPQFMFKTHLDFTQFNDIGNEDALMLADLYLYVTRCIHPLRMGGSYRQQRNQFLSTIVGRHYKWLLLHLPKFGHTLSLKYAETFGQNNIESTARLWQLLQHNAGYLQVLQVPEKDSILIRNALKADLEGNFDIINAKKIDALIAQQERINDAELQAIFERNALAIDIKVKFTELKNMSIEDERSRNFREECRMETAHEKYLQGRQALLAVSDRQHEKYHSVLLGMREAQRHREVNLDREWRSEDFVSIGRITEPTVVCAALYRLFVKIDRATAHLLQDQVALDDPEGAECFGDYAENDHLKRRRVQSYIERAIINREQSSAKKETDLAADLDSYEEKNNRLVYLLQEAAYICRAVVNVAENHTGHVYQFKESGVVKPLMSLLAQVYLFSCRFESLFMPMSFHYLAMPTEALYAIRYLVKCGTGRRRTNAKMSFLFAETGAIALCLEVIKFHLNDMTIASVAIETLFVLIDAPGVAENNLKILMADVNNLILLIVVLEKYSEYFSPVALNLHSCIIGIIAHLMHAGEYDAILRVYRGQLMVPIFDTILPLIDETAEPELCTRLCVSIQYIWYSPEYQNSHYFTSDFVPRNESFAREVAKYVNFRVALRFLKKILTIHFSDDVVVLAALLALGNIVFNNDKIKQEAYKMKLHESVAKVLRDRMRRLNAICALKSGSTVQSHNEDSAGTLEETEALRGQLHITREVLFEGLITAANLIVVPPFLTYETVQPDAGVGMDQLIVNAQLKSPQKGITAAVGNVKSAAAVQEESNNALAHFVQAGLSELVMNLITNHMEDRVIIRSVLIFANKFMYRGRFMSASRLVKLRFCEKVRVKQNKLVQNFFRN